MFRKVLVNFSLIGLGTYAYIQNTELHIYATIDFHQQCELNGVQSQSYTVQTDDGYLLQLFRIGSPSADKKPVLLVPGMSSTSDCFTINLNTQPLAYFLLDKGYDVWLANCRGSYYSRQHIKYDAEKDKEYWDWNCESIGELDLPAFFKKITEETGQKINYIGHSQGGAVCTCLIGELPEYEKYLNVVICLASPGPYLTGESFWFRFGINDFSIFMQSYFNKFCILGQSSIFFARLVRAFQTIATWLSQDLYNPHLHNDDDRTISVFVRRSSGGTSIQNAQFIKQLLNWEPRTYLLKYDYGKEGNLKKYKKETPDRIYFNKINVPVGILYGEYDHVVIPQDSLAFKESLNQNSLALFKGYPLDHGGFLLSSYTNHYSDILDLIEKYSS